MGPFVICPPQSNPYPQVGQPDIFNRTWYLFFNTVAAILRKPLVRVGLRVDRLALSPLSVFEGTLFTETDTGLIYQMVVVNGVPGWYYVSGVYVLAQAAIAAFVATLGTGDAGALLDSSDYFHRYRWDGAALGFDADAAEYILIGSPRGGPPQGGLWGLCDGTAYNVAQSNGTIASVTTSDLTGDVAILGATTPDAAQRAAARASWEAAAKTDDEAAHTHHVLVNSSDGGAAGVDFDFAHPGDYLSGAGSAHHHALSDANAQLKVPSEANGGLGVRIAVTFYLRR